MSDPSDIPEGLTPSRAGDGTYYGLLADALYAGYQWRRNDLPDTEWTPPTIGDRDGPHSRGFVQCRPIPRPGTERVPWWEAVKDQRTLPTGAKVVGARSADGTVFLRNGIYDLVEARPDGMVEVLLGDGDE